MSGKKPFFLTGGNAKITINGVTIAFATNINYSVAVNHTSPRVLGRYEVEEHQPLAYDVTGAFTIIRYAKGLADMIGKASSPNNVSERGNGPGSWTQTGAGHEIRKMAGLPNTDFQFDGRADDSLVPSRFFQSQMFDIEIRQQLHGKCDMIFSKLRDCRITGADFALTKKGVATETFRFKARYVDEDTFTARKSGVGQELT